MWAAPELLAGRRGQGRPAWRHAEHAAWASGVRVPNKRPFVFITKYNISMLLVDLISEFGFIMNSLTSYRFIFSMKLL